MRFELYLLAIVLSASYEFCYQSQIYEKSVDLSYAISSELHHCHRLCQL